MHAWIPFYIYVNPPLWLRADCTNILISIAGCLEDACYEKINQSISHRYTLVIVHDVMAAFAFKQTELSLQKDGWK